MSNDVFIGSFLQLLQIEQDSQCQSSSGIVDSFGVRQNIWKERSHVSQIRSDFSCP